MAPDGLRERVAAQFAGSGGRGDVWRVFGRLLATDAFLNLGYSRWYQPHVLGSPQRRLATVVGRHLAAHLPQTDEVALLDVGCGRGGPAIDLADRFGFDVTGVDLVPANVSRARSNAGVASRDVSPAFVVGDATRLPVRPTSMGACTAVDALVYVPDRGAAFAELADALEPGGILVVTDLHSAPGLDPDAQDTVARFADAWDMPPPASRPVYEGLLADAGFDVRVSTDVSAHSVGRFRRWTTPVAWLVDSPLRGAIERSLARWGLDATAVLEQVRRAHDALPWLRHGLLVAERRR